MWTVRGGGDEPAGTACLLFVFPEPRRPVTLPSQLRPLCKVLREPEMNRERQEDRLAGPGRAGCALHSSEQAAHRRIA